MLPEIWSNKKGGAMFMQVYRLGAAAIVAALKRSEAAAGEV